LGHPLWHRSPLGMDRRCPSDPPRLVGPSAGSLRLSGHGMDGALAPNPSVPLGLDRIGRRHPPPAVACLGLCLEAAALRPGPGSPTGGEDATDPPVRPGVGTARRLPLRGRDRPPAVPAVAGLLGAL